MLSRWTSGLIAFFFVTMTMFFLSVAVAAQSSPVTSTQGEATASPGSPIPQAAATVVDDDDDNPDIPPFARGRIDEKEYLQLRDKHIGTLRGLKDLARNPHARSQAIGKMETQEQAQALRRARATPANGSGQPPSNLANPSWTPLGPDPIPNGQTVSTSAAVSGRVTSIAVDPTNENIVYVGTAQGGLYRSLDGGLTWLPLMDSTQSLAIGALTLDPTDPSILFVGTGEGNFSVDSFFGVGVYVITNANSSMVTPSVNPLHTEAITGNDIFTGRSITRILVNPANDSQILVSTASGFSGDSGDPFSTLPSRGVYASNNVFSSPGVVGSPTFTKLSIFTGNGANRSVTDMIMDPGAPGTVLVAVFGLNSPGDGGIWVTNNAWTATPTWTQTDRQPSHTTNGFTAVAKFAVSRSTVGTPTTTFFASFDETVSCTPPGGQAVNVTGTLFSSTDGRTFPGPGLPAANGFCGGQCWYDMAIAANPTDPTKLYIGGNGVSGRVGACGTGPMGISTNGGASFTTSETSLHADSHVTVVSLHNPSVVYTGNDGGIFRSNDGGMTWTSLNNAGFTATQFESIAVHPTDPKFTIGGTQDNGTEFMKPDGTWTRADFGDGGFSAIDQTATDTTNVTMYHTYFNKSSTQVGFATVSTVTSATDGNWRAFGCGSGFTANGIGCSDAVLFYAPLALGPGTPNTVYFGTDRLYRSTNNGATMTVVSQAPLVSGIPISAIGISPQNDNVRLVGLGEDPNTGTPNGHVFVTTSGSSTLTDVTGGWTPEYIARAVIDPNTATTAYITLDGYGTPNHVWKTTNLSETPGVTAWTVASSGLPDVPVNALVVDPTNSNLLYVGTDIGVYNSTDGGATWTPYGTGLPRVAVFDLKITPGHTVRIATHGRGMWEIPAVIATTLSTTTGLSASVTSTTFGTPVTFTATVNTGTSTTVPTGNVTFLDGGASLAIIAVNASSQALFSTSTLSVASHSITAHYSGDLVYAPSTSSAQVVNVANASNADYSLSIPSGSATVQPGVSATYTINLTPTNGFTGTVNFACTSGVPTLAACSFNPAAVTLNGGGQGSTTLTISTTAPTAASPASGLGARLATGGGLFGLLLVFGFATKETWRRTLFMMLGVLSLTMSLISCGGGPSTPHNPGTPAGTFTVTISATSGTTTHTSTITLTVQ